MASSVRATRGPRIRGAGGVEIATYHLGGEGEPVVLLHATGFHGRCWQPMAARLTPAFSVWAIDQRGHGASGKDPGDRYDDWEIFVDDLLAVVDSLGEGEWRAVGHSLGGTVLLLAEARRPGTFVELCCYEPVVFEKLHFEGRNPLADLARRRRRSFGSRAAALANYSTKPPFHRWDPEALRAYVEHGFVELPDGTVRLACDPEDEASVFEGAVVNSAWDRLPDVRSPVAVFGGGDEDDPIDLDAEKVARRLPRGGARRFPDLSHFGPFEDPVGVGDAVMAAFGAAPAAWFDRRGSTMTVSPRR